MYAVGCGVLRLCGFPASDIMKEVRGQGLMLGIEFREPVKEIRSRLLYEKHIFTGVSGSSTLRLLAPLCLSIAEAERFVEALKELI